MALPGSLALVFLTFSLIPGWWHLRLLERTRPAGKTGGLNELLQVLAVGLATTGSAILVLILLPKGWPNDWLADPAALFKGGNAYAQANLRRVAVTAAAVLALACVIAILLYYVRSVGSQRGFKQLGDPWVYSLGNWPKDKVPYIAIELTDGRQIEGVLHTYSTDNGSSKPDIALKDCIRITPKDEDEPIRTLHDIVVVPGDQIVLVSLRILSSDSTRSSG
ncbi:DUF6338 family protein [Nocardia sp. NPDC004654]|uniref:DUF6338 family protein n=1 Tax=Nocardia sp. NPDC004654 TaxID=3154776 RepID=UPI0033BB7301